MAAGPREDDLRWMRRALELAERGWGRVAPNPLVGAVVVREGEPVGEGWHAEYGGPHAEVQALRGAGERARGATLYVTLEPCAHHGKTPPCTDAVLAAGVSRLVFAAPDPSPAAGGGAERLTAAGVEVVGGVEDQEARDLNAPFFHGLSPAGVDRPWIELKMALSLDARVADRDGRSAWITGEESRAEVHRLRAGRDAVAVGVGTVLADDPLLTPRGPFEPRRTPARVVFDRRLRTPVESRLVRSAGEAPLWVLAGPDAPGERRARLESVGVRVLEAGDLLEGLRGLRREGLGSVLFEGGAALASALVSAEVVDRLTLFYAPLLLGPAGVDPFRDTASPALGQAGRWRPVRTQVFGQDTMLVLAR